MEGKVKNPVVVCWKRPGFFERFQTELAAHLLKDFGITMHIVESVEQAKVLESKASVDVLLAWNHEDSTEALLSAHPNIKFIQTIFTGVENTVKSKALQARSAEFVVANTKGCFDASLAEFVLGAGIFFLKRFPDFERQRKAGCWPPSYPAFPHRCLTGKTLGIVGVGGIGSALSKMAKLAFGMKIIAIKRNLLKVDEVEADKVLPLSELKTLCSEADLIVSALPKTPETHGLFNMDVFKSMKPTAVFVNVGRGVHVVESDLVAALKEGVIAGAALDVTWPEPIPPDSPFYKDKGLEDKLLLGFHTAHSYMGFERDIASVIGENIKRYSRGEPPHNTIKVDDGY